jgi:hypothetical protein
MNLKKESNDSFQKQTHHGKALNNVKKAINALFRFINEYGTSKSRLKT